MSDYFILSEYLLVEKGNRSEIVSLKEISVIGGLESLEVYADVLEEIEDDLTCFVGSTSVCEPP
jgi:hypothetical protein